MIQIDCLFVEGIEWVTSVWLVIVGRPASDKPMYIGMPRDLLQRFIASNIIADTKKTLPNCPALGSLPLLIFCNDIERCYDQPFGSKLESYVA